MFLEFLEPPARGYLCVALVLSARCTRTRADRVTPDLSVGASYYVAPAGNDENPGTLAAPFATLERARDAIRTLRNTSGLPAHGISVYLRGSVHQRSKSFALTAQDSGTPSAPIVYQGYPGEDVRVVGAMQLDPSWFTRVDETSAVWNRLDVTAHGVVYEVDLGAHGITDYGSIQPRGFGTSYPEVQLFWNHAPGTLARWPDQGFSQTVTVPSATEFKVKADDARLNRWRTAEEIWVHGYFKWLWADSRVQVKSIDPSTQTISLTTRPQYVEDTGIDSDMPYIAENLLEEITRPGEWYLNRTTGKLYVWPLGPLAGAEVGVDVQSVSKVAISMLNNFNGLQR